MQSIRLFGVGVVCAVLAAVGCAGQPAARECPNGIVCPEGTQCAAVQTVCIVGNCGNGLPDPGEQCDDGNILDGDGCSATCKTEACGNGVQDPGEECDDGNNVSGDKCSADCKSREVCGNNIRDVNEACDDNNTVSGDGCSADCKSTEICGNNITDIHELCDDGRMPGGCNDDCQGGTGCGDGNIDKDGMGRPIEQCDDGNTNDNDDCLSSKGTLATTCKLAKCGDGVRQTTGARLEDCDDGVNGVATETAGCNIDCSAPRCGDSKINFHFKPDGTHGEQCDAGDGLNNDNADCTAGCQINVCGDGHRNTTGTNKEDCDNGALNGTPGNACTTTCHLKDCGNGILEQDEQCDDGANNGLTKRCSPTCKFNVCGDGQTFTGVEQCDDGVNNVPKDTATCDVDCTAAVCGDGRINTVAGEVCDNGANNGKVGNPCSLTCKTVNCGNNTVEQGEECDDGAGNGPNNRCNACKLNVCGDGLRLNGTEQCDDGVGGVKKDSLTCDDDCTLSVCGDGHKNTLAGETCDDGANNGKAGSTCNSFCKLVACGNGFVDTGEQCDPNTGTPATDSATCDSDCTAKVCGDSHINTAGGEACDDGANNGNPCGYNDRTCTRCNATCTGTTQPGGPFCGDSLVTNGEVCDQGLLRNGQQCAYGDLACLSGANSTVCNINCSGLIANPNGPFCGDTVVQSAFREQCDPGGGVTPVDGATCDNDCTFAQCGDGHKNANAGETCDDGNASSCGACSATCGAITLDFAKGSITVDAGNLMTNGDTFTLDDGFHTPTVFEYQKTGTFTVGNVQIQLESTGADTAAAVRDKTIAAINAVATLDINAVDGSAGGQPGKLLLTNTHQSSLGNKPINETVVAVTFTVTPMAGGLGGDCLTGVGCTQNADCASGTCNLATARCQ